MTQFNAESSGVDPASTEPASTGPASTVSGHNREEPVAEHATGSHGHADAGDGVNDGVVYDGGADESEDSSDASAEEAPPETAEESLQRQLAERTADLQRLQAEYVNYRRRVERDRTTSRGQGKTDVLKSMLTVLDDLGRADEHGELTGGFKAVSDQLWNVVRSHKLEQFGQAGDEFDPRLHEALYNAGTSPDIQHTSVAQVVKVGYRVEDEIIRHAEVGVFEPEDSHSAASSDESGSADEEHTDSQ